MRRVAFALAMLCISSSVARAGYDEGMAAFKRSDYATAFHALKPFAEQGNAQAQSTLGLLYARGTGVSQDYEKAIKWFSRAAAQGNAQGQFGLGFMHGKGIAVPLDYGKAVQLFQKAAEQGYGPAQFGLGLMYVMGQGIPRNYVKACMWFSIAAAQGNDEAAVLRDQIAKKLTSASLAEARELTNEWLAAH